MLKLLPEPLEPLLSLTEAGRILHMHPKTLSRKVADGLLPFVQVGCHMRFKPGVLRAYIDERAVPAKAA